MSTSASTSTSTHMNATLRIVKPSLRKEMTKRLNLIPIESIQNQSKAVTDRVVASSSYQQAKRLSCYLSTPRSEIQTDDLVLHALNNQKVVYIPYCPSTSTTLMIMLPLSSIDQFRQLKTNRWGIREFREEEIAGMKPANELDLILVPGLAFDSKRQRLGHGRGYYDRYIVGLEGVKPRLMALALTEQMVGEGEEVPVSEYDVKMDIIVTPEGEI